VYIGRISSEVSDDFVKQLLERCGKVTKWNRAADPNSSKLTSFGFCDFEEPQGVWRALEFLHKKQLCDRRLLVKCEDKVRERIDKWTLDQKEEIRKKRLEKRSKSKEEDKEDGATKEGTEEEKPKDDKAGVEDRPKEDEPSQEGGEEQGGEPLTEEQLDAALRADNKEIEEELNRWLQEKSKTFPEVKEDEGETKEDDQKNVAQKATEGVDGVEPKDEKQASGKEEPVKEKTAANRDRPRSRSRGRRGGNAGRSEERRGQREDERAARPRVVSRDYRQPRCERERQDRARERTRDIEKAYSHRLREFERNEERRITRLKQDLRELQTITELTEREKRKLIDRDRHFGKRESEEMDWKRHREDRADRRRRENEKDAKDREEEESELQKEKKKREEEERRVREEKEAEEKRIRDEERARREEKERKEREELEHQRAEEKRIRDAELKKQEEELARKREEERKIKEAEQKKQQEAAAAKLLQSISASVQDEIRHSGPADSAAGEPPRSGGGGSGAAANPNPNNPGAQAMNALFRAGEEPLDANGQPRKHRPLTRLDEQRPPPASGSGAADASLRNEEMRRLIQQVPTEKEKAFAFPIDWDSVADHDIVERKLRPWVRKKVSEYLGTDEQTMIDFIIRKVSSRADPASILAELEGFLDEEAENFTLKMWRMLIFEVLRVKSR